jgi:molecular chaperone GrpE
MEASANENDEEFIDEDEADMGPAALKKLREKLQKALEEKQEYLDGWQRAQADFANFKRQEALINADRGERLKAEFVETLLPMLDVLELAIRHDKTNDPTLKMLEQKFLDSLKAYGVEKFGAVGESFDPHKHEALAEQGKDHTVISVERSGYKIGSKIIRPAQVII